MVNRLDSKANKKLIITFFTLVLIAIVLLLSIFFINQNRPTAKIDIDAILAEVADLPDQSKAATLSNNIAHKISDSSDYSPEEALAEYDAIYNNSVGDLKVYIAIEYASYVYEISGDIDRAQQIMNVEEYLNSDNELAYYVTLLNLYTLDGNEEKITEYQQIVDEKAPKIFLTEGSEIYE